ncbi:MAG: hypothetical protein DRN40_02550 [Thermoplasmata archaeon]|nr:MAG: hypothetical protein DRN28_03695 [Thermoplasmata archaeon]RLF71415.1 MAG: hypothetical protein DRN40_02550 [Thermoplasmata archaeon]
MPTIIIMRISRVLIISFLISGFFSGVGAEGIGGGVGACGTFAGLGAPVGGSEYIGAAIETTSRGYMFLIILIVFCRQGVSHPYPPCSVA